MYNRAYYIEMKYQWDAAKAESNRERHGVRFADAVGVLEDEAALSREDLASEGERRSVVTGLDFLGRVLTVVYTWRGNDLRLISARRASGKERRAYEGE